MQPAKYTPALIICSLCLMYACEPDELVIPPNPNIPTEVVIEAKLPAVLYSNKKEITLDASAMKALNGNRSLKYLWTCTQFPDGRTPAIMYPESVSTPVSNLDTGKYNFHLWAKDSYGNEANADYRLTVLPDTLTGPPVISSMAHTTYELPEPVRLEGPSDIYLVNPVDRALKFKWTLVEQPAGTSAVIISNETTLQAEAIGCVPGNYVFQLEVTNELQLKTSGLMQVTVAPDPMAGTVKIYDNLKWTSFKDEDGAVYVYLTVYDPQINFTYRNNYKTEVSLWDFTNQVWQTLTEYEWSGYGNSFTINNVDNVVDGAPARIRVMFK